MHPSRLLPVPMTALVVSLASAQALVTEDNESLAADVKQIFRSRCSECHGKTRRESDIDILDMSTYVGPEGQVVRNDVDQSSLFDYISSDDEDLRMPEPPLPALESFEIATVRRWIEAGAPAFPQDVDLPIKSPSDLALSSVVGAEYVLTQILNHIETVPRDDRKFIRFFSSNHMLTDGASAHELDVQRQALAKAINHLSWQPTIVKPIVIDGETATIFAVDIRSLGWSDTPFQSGFDQLANGEEVDLFDLVLLEYPYGLVFENSETFARLAEFYMQPAGLIRPIPFIRIDWFVSVATQAPLYEDLLQLPHQLSELETTLGVDGAQNMATHVAKRAGMTVSGVSRNNRVVERHPAKHGAYWKSYDFDSSKGLQNMFVDPINFHFSGGEMIWNLPNGLQAYMVTDRAGNRILEAPTSIVTDKFAEDKVVRNGLSCIRCHDQGIKRFADKIRPAFESLPSSSHRNRQEILRLYVEKEQMDALLDRDGKKFMNAMQEALGHAQQKEPLIPTTRRFIDAPLTISQAAAELGLEDATGLEQIFQLPQFARLGLTGLTNGGVVRRDTWEDYFDRIARQLGQGLPVAPVDGNSRNDHLPDNLAFDLKLKTSKPSNIYSPGEEMVITVKNDTGVDLFIELIGTSARGNKAVLTKDVLEVSSGEAYRFPQQGSIKIQPQLGTEFITVFANPTQFAPGVLLKGDGVADRFVHDFYRYDPENARLSNEPVQLIKKTLKIETR